MMAPWHYKYSLSVDVHALKLFVLSWWICFKTVLKLMRDMVDLFQTVLNAFALDINNPAVA